MTGEEYTSRMQWIRDQYLTALEFNEAYMPSLRAIPDRVRTGELTPAEGRDLFDLYERTKAELDRHIAEVMEMEAELNRNFTSSSTDSSTAAASTVSTTATTSNPR